MEYNKESKGSEINGYVSSGGIRWKYNDMTFQQISR